MIVNSIDELIDTFLNRTSPELIYRKAGKWQGINTYEGYHMYVLRDVNLIIPILENNELRSITNPDLPWAENHFKERVGGYPLNPGESYKIWPYNNFKDIDDQFKKGIGNIFEHTYMERFWPKAAGDQVNREGFVKGVRFTLGDYDDVISQLIENPLTRQAFLPIFFPEDTGAKDNMRVPCTIGYLFEVFDGRLDVTYYIRSCDIFRHFRNDVYLAMRLASHTCDLINSLKSYELKPGTLNMKIANCHLFENDHYMFNKKEKKIKDGKQ